MSATQRNTQKVQLSGIPAEMQGTYQAMSLGDMPILIQEDGGEGWGSLEEPRSGHPVHPAAPLPSLYCAPHLCNFLILDNGIS